MDGGEPVSAGFVNMTTGQVYGESKSMLLKPRPGDEYIVAKVMLGLDATAHYLV